MVETITEFGINVAALGMDVVERMTAKANSLMSSGFSKAKALRDAVSNVNISVTGTAKADMPQTQTIGANEKGDTSVEAGKTPGEETEDEVFGDEVFGGAIGGVDDEQQNDDTGLGSARGGLHLRKRGIMRAA